MRVKWSAVCRYARMLSAELRSEAAELDTEIVVTKSKPLTAEESALGGNERANGLGGRPGDAARR